MDEIRLVQDAQKGDLNAFNRLILEYQDRVYNTAYRVLGDDAQAQDAVQEAFIAAYNNLDSFRGGSFKAWLLRVVTNKCYDELRRKQRQPSVPLEPFNPETEEDIENPTWLVDNAITPEESAELSALDTAIQNCLNKLPENFRVVVVLIDIQGYDYQSVSEAVKKPLGTIKSRLARARTQLKDCLKRFRELLPVGIRLDDEGTL
jgi:RNA polymerase sigma-70 factor (ECF subfamily)